MALDTLSKNQLGTGVHFYWFSGIFLGGIILSSILGFKGVFAFMGVLILWSLVALYAPRKSIPFLFIVSLLGPLLTYYEIDTIDRDRQLLSQSLQQASSSATGEILSVGGTRNGKIPSVVELHGFTVRLDLLPGQKILPGDMVQLSGIQISPTPSYFDKARSIDARITAEYSEVITTQNKSFFHSLRSSFVQKVEDSFPPPIAGLLAGVLLGDASLLDQESTETFRKIGLSHLMVVSGSNIAFVLAFVLLCVQPFPKRYRITLGISAMICYVLLVGTDPPVLRAAIMGGIGFLGFQLSSSLNIFRVLLFACVLLSILSPLSMVYDVGFQLSFLATFGLICAGTLLKKKAAIVQYVGASAFAAVWTLPVTIGVFGTFHAWSIVANMLAGPVIGVVMLGGAISLSFSYLLEWLAYHIGYIPYFGLVWVNRVATYFSSLPGFWEVPEGLIRLSISTAALGVIVSLSLRYLHLQAPKEKSVSLSAK